MKLKAKQVIIISISLLLVTAVAVGLYMYNRGPVNIRTSRSVDVCAINVYKEYLSDSAAARKNYDGKVLSITGRVSDIGKNQQGEPIVKLETGTDGGYINCTMDEPVSLQEGQDAIIKGLCSGMGQGEPELGIPGDVYITRAIFIKQ